MTLQPEIDLFKQMPVPPNLFQGLNFPRSRIPEEVLLFYRGSPQDAMTYGNMAQHHRFVLCFCFKTPGSVQIDAEVFDLHPLEGNLIFPYQPHHFTQFSAAEIAWLFISFEIKDSDWLEPLRNTVFSLNDHIIQLLNKMAEISLEQRGEMISPLLVLLLDNLLNSTSITRTATQNAFFNGNLSATLQFIHQNLDAPIQTRDVIAQSGYSETVLRHLFSKYLNTSIAAYIRRMRILRACHLLDTSSETIGSISDQCGFSSQYAFSRTFKEVIGKSPNAYRKQLA
jgi:AraC-like DNA-binding protein